MIDFLQKLVIIWEKKKLLNTIRLEAIWVKNKIDEFAIDEEETRKEMAELKAIKNPKQETKLRALELEQKLTEMNGWKQQFVMSAKRLEEFEEQIAMFKQHLWK